MRRKHLLFLLPSLLLISAVLIGCPSRAPQPHPSGHDVPDWYLNPEEVIMDKFGAEASYFFGTGQATKVVPSLAKTTADARAINEIARQVGLEVKTRIRDHMAQAGVTGSNPGVLEFSDAVTKQVAATNLVGARTIKRAVSKDGKTYYSLAVYSLNEAQKLAAQTVAQVKNQYMNNQEALFNEFKAKQAFDELDAENVVKAMQPAGGANPETD